MNRKFCKLAATAGLALTLGLANFLAQAQQTRWIVATGFAESNFQVQTIRAFADDLMKASGGRLELVVHSNASLIRLPDILRAVQTGQVHAGDVLLFLHGNLDPFFELDTIPFVAVGYEEARRLYQLQRPFLERRLAERGVRPLFYVPWPGQGVVSQNRIESAAGLKGSKMRTAGATTARFAELLGARPTIVQTAEVSMAFATNMVDSSIYSPTTAVDTRAWEYAKFFHNTRAMHSKDAFVVNQRAFDALADDLKKIVLDSAAKAETRGWEISQRREKEALEEIRNKGMQVVEPSEKLMGELRVVGAKMLEEWVQKTAAEGKALRDNLK
ncbi:MAG: C4-dicarboxylate ABC transporter substrate-binding protein [Betaproteobacteria bacterium]|nr:C4-dicarboxylate ABC transporter substrate-binding protein [Betaproteobacteria bacterium]